MICRWHLCRKPFQRQHNRQVFCKPICRKARDAWKEKRGARLIDHLIKGDASAMASERAKLLKEIGEPHAKQ